MNDHRYHNNLEQFLQSQADKHKLYPEDRIWRNIYKELHEYKNWYALPIVSLCIIVALTISTIIYDNLTKGNFITPAILVHSTTSDTTLINQNTLFAEQLINQEYTYPIHHKKQNIVSNTINNVTEDIEPTINSTKTIAQKENTETINTIEIVNDEAINNKIPLTNNITTSAPYYTLNKLTHYNTIQKQTVKQLNNIIEFKNIQHSTNTVESNYENIAPHKIQKPTKFELQVYATPSISFRRLADDKARNIISLRSTDPTGAPLSSQYFADVNDVVRHKPALGLEAGVGILYKLSDKIKIRAGLQFNMRKYYIDSYKSGANIAQIAVVTSNGIDTINQISTSSNTDGYANATLKNRLYQASIPIGIQWQLFQKDRFSISVGASIQPTLTLNKNVYLLSTDYKFYTDGTSFFRKWNINTDLDINFAYKVGDYHFFISPQVRYQHLPTYNDNYPIKEYRLDNGLRIGFIKQIFK
ncbi:MAG: outer membrane beta-barrel protein [Chitinophagaceae bacterium]|nr:outer membrane beta-barrel protein [Chitinophagaceae bacterium]